MCVCFKPDNPFSSYDWGERKGLAATGFEPASPWRDLNPQSLAPRASTLSIRSHGALPMSYAAVKFMQANMVHASKFIATNFANRRNKNKLCRSCDKYCKIIAWRNGFWSHILSIVVSISQRVNSQRIAHQRQYWQSQLDTCSGILFSLLKL